MCSNANSSGTGHSLSHGQTKVQTPGCQILHESKFGRGGPCHGGESQEQGELGGLLFFSLFQRVAPACKIGVTVVLYVTGRIMTPPKDVHTLIPRLCDYVTLHGKRDFPDVSKIMNLEMGRLSWIIYVDTI